MTENIEKHPIELDDYECELIIKNAIIFGQLKATLIRMSKKKGIHIIHMSFQGLTPDLSLQHAISRTRMFLSGSNELTFYPLHYHFIYSSTSSIENKTLPSIPPATVIVCPLTCPANLSEERYRIACVISEGVATLRRGIV